MDMPSSSASSSGGALNQETLEKSRKKKSDRPDRNHEAPATPTGMQYYKFRPAMTAADWNGGMAPKPNLYNSSKLHTNDDSLTPQTARRGTSGQMSGNPNVPSASGKMLPGNTNADIGKAKKMNDPNEQNVDLGKVFQEAREQVMEEYQDALTAEERKNIPAKKFANPKAGKAESGSFPMEDKKHARLAVAFMKHASPEVRKRIVRKATAMGVDVSPESKKRAGLAVQDELTDSLQKGPQHMYQTEYAELMGLLKRRGRKK